MRHSIINKSPTLITFILFVILTQYIFINLYEVIANFIVSTLNDVKKITKFQKKKRTLIISIYNIRDIEIVLKKLHHKKNGTKKK